MHKKPLILKRLKALKQFLLSKDSRNQILKQAVHTLYLQEETPKQKIPTYPPADILPITTCSLQPIALQDGNLSLKELLTLTAFLQAYRPKNLLEIGTFNGATTLHMALNTPAQSTIHTLDLSQVENYPQEALEPEDIKYISSPIKKEKLYHSTPYAPK
ncbi:MAG: hypothetical protein FJZ63_07935, partial [Chlamydiae bacterium]|nr:hypothetical protein [Chlamydiota bacterium]